MQHDTYVRDISTLRITDAEEAGGQGANMGELVAAKLPVPPGFVLQLLLEAALELPRKRRGSDEHDH